MSWVQRLVRAGKDWRRSKFGPPTQASLFHYIREDDPDQPVDTEWLRHPVQFFKEEWRAPRTQASLFHYVNEEGSAARMTWKELVRDVFTGSRGPLFISSVFADQQGLMFERARFRIRLAEAGTISLFVHVAVLVVLLLGIFNQPDIPVPENMVFINPSPIYIPVIGDGRDGGGGGGGGKEEKIPASHGRIPERTAIVVPDPTEPQPLLPDESDQLAASVQMPIDIPQDMSLPVGDISAPPSNSRSSGSGSGGGIGSGQGTGIGSGSGPGVGPGSGGGMGGGSGGGIGSGTGPYVMGSGVRAPVAIVQPLPAYTEEARKARTEGIVLLSAVVRRNGTVDSIKVLRGLGYGLDESAIHTIANKWRFRPGTLNGTPVDVQANIEVSFRLY